jgi:hypothetical protein
MPKVKLPYISLYGPTWREPHWKDNIVSVWEGRAYKAGHHCPDPDCVAISKECFTKKLHAAFCCVVIELPDGKRRYCGLRFQIDSPHGCAMHPFTVFEDNRFFQAAKAGLPYELPSEIPHEDDPNWSMTLSGGFGSHRMPIRIFMDRSGGEVSFIGVHTSLGSRTPPVDLGRVPPRDLLLTKDRVKEATPAEEPDDNGLSKAMESVKLDEREGKLLNHDAPHTIFNTIKNDNKTQHDWARKDARKALQAEAQSKTTKTGAKKKVFSARDFIKKKSRKPGS